MKELEQLEKEHQELGKKIQELKDSLNKPKGFEVDRWYKSTTGSVACFKGFPFKGYGLGAGIVWRDNDWDWSDLSEWKPANEQEVKDALIKEAERIGYKEGVEIKHLLYERVGFLDYGFTGFRNNCFTEFWYKGLIVMKDGKWATIIKDETIKIGGYEVKFHQIAKDGAWYSTTIDGYGYSHYFWKSAKEIYLHPNAKVMIGYSKQFDVSLETINKILDKLK